MAIKKLGPGRWRADVKLTPTIRRRKILPTKATAGAWIEDTKSQFRRDPVGTSSRDRRKLSHLVDQWYDLHGATLKDGAARKRKLLNFAKSISDPRADKFNAAHFTAWRDDKIGKVTPATINRLHSYLRAVFNELSRLGQWQRPNPLTGIRQFRVDEFELVYLTPGQIDDLLAACKTSRNPHTHPVALVCLATGARWTEAETLTRDALHTDRITFKKTKGGKARTVPVDSKLVDFLLAHADQHNTDGGRLFAFCYDSFRNALARSGVTLPRGQASHVLRHTFASHYIQHAARPDALLTLQRLLGHSDIKLTLRYAHLAPDALESAREFNPMGHFWDTPGKPARKAAKRSTRKKQ